MVSKMPYDPNKHHRRSIRLKGYDYSLSGAYFVTICTYQRECLLGQILNKQVHLSEYGKIVEYTWYDLPNHNAYIELDAFVIMPDHVHGIIVIRDDIMGVGVGSEPTPTPNEPTPTIIMPEPTVTPNEPTPTIITPTEPTPNTNPSKNKKHPLSEIVRQFKTFSARRINELRQTKGVPVWQRNYYERIIRDEKEFLAVQRYIYNNPLNWQGN
ncbi:MAG: transposase [Raineya sp.]|nr:transposase [Raineya sp.]MDW8296552.1 transposase [Raineya sp.]